MKKILLLISFSFTLSISAQHKFLNTPKLDKKDVELTTYAKQADEVAEVLYRSHHYQIDLNGSMNVEVFSRIKIYNKDNVDDYLTVEIPTREYNGKRENIFELKAVTYNMENGKVVATKVDKESKFKSKEYKNVNITRFTFSNVKNGSVIEYKYKINTPFYYQIPTVMIEDAIPSRLVEYVFDAPNNTHYNINYKGQLIPKHQDVSEKNIFGGEYNTYRFAYINVPAYKEEKFVYNMNNYRTSIKAELNSVFIEAYAGNGYNSSSSEVKNFAVTWDDIAKTLSKDSDFGAQLDRRNLVKDILPADIKSIAIKEDRAAAVFNFVKKNYTWNKESSLYTEEGIKNLLEKKIGNSAEINLLMVMLLKSADIDTNPIVLSTRDRGLLTAYSPSITSLNYVVASALINKKLIIFDPTSKFSQPNVLPLRVYNYLGYKLADDKAVRVNLLPEKNSKTKLIVDAKLNIDGTFEGSFKDIDTNLYALIAGESYEGDQTAYEKEYKENYKFPFSNIKSELLNNGEFQTSFNFNSDGFADGLGGKLVFNPLLFLYRKTHDFDQTNERRSPIELATGYDRIKKVTVKLPEGYVFENVPKSKKFRTEDSSLQYNYVVTQEGNTLTVEATTTVMDPIYPKEFYPAFKQIFDNITKLESQLVTVVKKS